MAWCSIPHNLWPGIADCLRKPWPEEAVEADLCWWVEEAKRIATGRPGERAPGRRKMAERWGWNEEGRALRSAMERLSKLLKVATGAATEKPALAGQAGASKPTPVTTGDTRVPNECHTGSQVDAPKRALARSACPTPDTRVTHAQTTADTRPGDPLSISPRARAVSPRAIHHLDPDPGSASLSSSAPTAPEGRQASEGAPGRDAAADARRLGEVWAHARRYEPKLPSRHKGTFDPSLAEEDPALLCLVLDWAYRAPDPDAARLRKEAAEGRAGARSPAYILAPFRLADRVVRARTWEEAGRPLAGDAVLPAEEARAAEGAHQERLRAEDAERWPGWTPPSAFGGLPREYLGLVKDAEGAQAMAREEKWGHDLVGRKLLDQLKAKGWDPDWPVPGARSFTAADGGAS